MRPLADAGDVKNRRQRPFSQEASDPLLFSHHERLCSSNYSYVLVIFFDLVVGSFFIGTAALLIVVFPLVLVGIVQPPSQLSLKNGPSG